MAYRLVACLAHRYQIPLAAMPYFERQIRPVFQAVHMMDDLSRRVDPIRLADLALVVVHLKDDRPCPLPFG